MDQLIVITHPGRLNGEIGICKELFDCGLERLHVRKPQWNENEITNWLKHFTDDELSRMVIHHEQGIFEKMNLGGLHLSFLNEFAFTKKSRQTFSCSVHSWEEAENAFNFCDYVFISPVFDSISKIDYKQNSELLKVPDHFRSKKIFALGGIDNSNIHKIHEMGYYGAVILGHIWNKPEEAVENFNTLNKFVMHGA